MADLIVASDIRAIVLEVAVAPGDAVTEGQDLVILESMKTEIPVTAPRAGTVGTVHVAEGDEVDERQPLVPLQA